MTKTKTLMLLAASAVLTTGFALPSWSALQAAASDTSLAPLSALLGSDEMQRPLILADNDDNEDEGGSVTRRESDDDEDECEDDDGNCGAAATAAPAPAGSVPPPQNGLFDNSTAPKATVK